MKYVGWFFLIIVLMVGLSITGSVMNWFGRSADIVQQQVDPFELQRKYEWFKDTAAQLDDKQANIKVFEARKKHQHCDNAKDRVHIEQCDVWEQETAGVIASYNGLAAEYNAQMAKWNWRFTNVGQLPQGATQPLPREFKPYQEE